MRFPLPVLAVQPGHPPHILGIAAHFQPLLAHKLRPRPGFLGNGVIRNPHRVQVKIVVPGLGKKADGIVYRRKAASRPAHTWHFPIPDDFVHHHHPSFQESENFRGIPPSSENVETAGLLQLRQDGVNPRRRPLQKLPRLPLVRIVPVILAQAIGRVGDNQIHRPVGHPPCPGQEILIVKGITPAAVPHPNTMLCSPKHPPASHQLRRNAGSQRLWPRILELRHYRLILSNLD